MVQDLRRFLRERAAIPAGAEDATPTHGGDAQGAHFTFAAPSGERWLFQVNPHEASAQDVSHLYAVRATRFGDVPAHRVHAAVVSPKMPRPVRVWAGRLGIDHIRAPAGLLSTRPAAPAVRLTTAKSWAVTLTLLKLERIDGLQALAHETSQTLTSWHGSSQRVSLGWTHQVVQELQSAEIVRAARGEIRLATGALRRLHARVLQERALADLDAAIVPSGIHDWTALLEEIASWAIEPSSRSGERFVACGTSAAMTYTDEVTRTDRFEAYAWDLNELKQRTQARRGGIPLLIYPADRIELHTPHPPRRLSGRSVPTTNLAQTLMDVMGSGLATARLVRGLLEVLQDDE